MGFPKIGNKAPAFSLINQKGEKVSLKDFAGSKNVVVYFYPRAMTPGCTVQACGIRDYKKEFAKADRFVGIRHKNDWAIIRAIDAANGVSYDCK